MQKIHYNLTIGDWQANSQDDPRTEVVELEAVSVLNAPVDFCRAVLYSAPPPKSSLLDQAAGMATGMAAGALGLGGGGSQGFSLKVRGVDIHHGDPFSLELSCGDRSGKVFQGQVSRCESNLGQTVIEALNGGHTLARQRLNQLYQNRTFEAVLRDLAGQCQVEVGDLASGDTYPYLLVHERRSAWEQLLDLARREGVDLYFDEDGRLAAGRFESGDPDHSFDYGIDILDVQFFNRQPLASGRRVYGESPASQQGTRAWHWLVKDPAPYTGKTGEDSPILAESDAALRTKDAAQRSAASRLGAAKDASQGGLLWLLGRPDLRVEQAIQIRNAPKPEINGLFKVTGVRHHLSKRRGYLTWASFNGKGGAQDAAGALLGALAGMAGL